MNKILAALGVSTIVGGCILLVILYLIAMPLALIWAFNTLFPVVIEYTVVNWFAAFVLCIAFGASASSNSD